MYQTGTAGNQAYGLIIQRNGSNIYTRGNVFSSPNNARITHALKFDDFPGPGTHTYTVFMSSTSPAVGMSLSNLDANEFKK